MRSARPDNRQRPGHTLLHDEHGSVTAEFAVALPAVLIVLGLVIGGVALATHRITLVSIAADAARLEARGESAETVLARRGTNTQLERSTADGLHCVSLSSAPVGGLLASITVRARSCAAVSDVGALE